MDPQPSTTPAEELTLTLRRARHGGWSITTPAAPTFRASARTPPELARAVALAARAVQSTPPTARPAPPTPTTGVPDLDQLMLTTTFSRAEVFGGLRRKHDPAAWQPLTGGWWLSPGGKRYRPGSAQVVKVIAQRRSLGLPLSHDTDATLDLETP